MKHIPLSQLTPEAQCEMPNMVPSLDNYMVVIDGQTAVITSSGGIEHFGEEDWEMMVEGIHPDLPQPTPIDITVN